MSFFYNGKDNCYYGFQTCIYYNGWIIWVDDGNEIEIGQQIFAEKNGWV
jgi:hypothetical protein